VATTSDDILRTDLLGIPLRNPLLLAAGTAGYVDELAQAMDLSGIGGLVTKSITREQREGNPSWRVVETTGGMLNAVGLANLGSERFEHEVAPKIAKAPCAVIGSIAGSSVEDYVAVAQMFERIESVQAVELNVSCPNVHDGKQFGDDPLALGELVAAVRRALPSTKLIVKLPPAINEIVALSQSAIDSGAEALTIANTIPGMAIDVESRKPKLSNITGGLSGPAVHPVAVRLVHLTYTGCAHEAGIPIIGIGGVTTWRDAAEFILAGASAFGIGTTLFADPRAPGRILSGLAKWAKAQGVNSITDLVGAVEIAK
jgi:dihydroorotate dehydrogenase (NAD+) catalytic subunit